MCIHSFVSVLGPPRNPCGRPRARVVLRVLRVLVVLAASVAGRELGVEQTVALGLHVAHRQDDQQQHHNEQHRGPQHDLVLGDILRGHGARGRVPGAFTAARVLVVLVVSRAHRTFLEGQQHAAVRDRGVQRTHGAVLGGHHLCTARGRVRRLQRRQQPLDVVPHSAACRLPLVLVEGIDTREAHDHERLRRRRRRRLESTGEHRRLRELLGQHDVALHGTLQESVRLEDAVHVRLGHCHGREQAAATHGVVSGTRDLGGRRGLAQLGGDDRGDLGTGYVLLELKYLVVARCGRRVHTVHNRGVRTVHKHDGVRVHTGEDVGLRRTADGDLAGRRRVAAAREPHEVACGETERVHREPSEPRGRECRGQRRRVRVGGDGVVDEVFLRADHEHAVARDGTGAGEKERGGRGRERWTVAAAHGGERERRRREVRLLRVASARCSAFLGKDVGR